MLLREMFSPIGAPREDESEIDWVDDLKFFIDNDTDILSRQMFPAIKKHMKYVDHPKAFKLYLGPLKTCTEMYCEKFDVDGREEKFSEETIVKLAQKIAEEQKQYIQRGDYDAHK